MRTCNLHAYESPEEELHEAAKWACFVLERGYPAREICISVPNKTWQNNVVRALAACDLPARTIVSYPAARADVRDREHCRVAGALCLIMLAANPNDEAALRAWCGFGEYLTNSQVMREIHAYAEENGNSLAETLRDISVCARNPEEATRQYEFEFFREIQKVLAAYDELEDMLNQMKEVRGPRILELAGELLLLSDGDVQALQAVAGPLDDAASADDVAEAVRYNLSHDKLGGGSTEEAITVLPYAKCLSGGFSAMLVTGAVDGFIPSHATFDEVATSPERRERILATKARDLICALGQGRKIGAISCFTEAPARDAERMDLRIVRIYIRDGLRRAKISPTSLLEESAAEGNAI